MKNAYSVWEGLAAETTPPVNLLVGVVSGCNLESVEEVRGEAVKWCLGKKVELVIWETDSSPAEANEDGMYDTFFLLVPVISFVKIFSS